MVAMVRMVWWDMEGYGEAGMVGYGEDGVVVYGENREQKVMVVWWLL